MSYESDYESAWWDYASESDPAGPIEINTDPDVIGANYRDVDFSWFDNDPSLWDDPGWVNTGGSGGGNTGGFSSFWDDLGDLFSGAARDVIGGGVNAATQAANTAIAKKFGTQSRPATTPAPNTNSGSMLPMLLTVGGAIAAAFLLN